MADAEPHIERIHCNNCGCETKHERKHHITHQDVTHVYDEDSREVEVDTWRHVENALYECLGCEDVTLRRSEQTWLMDPDEESVTYFPPRVWRRLPEWLTQVDDADIKGLFNEVYAALQADSRRLATMGCRAVLDRIMVKAVGDVGGFEQKLDRMVAEQLLSKPDRDALDAAIDAGSASAHRGYSPTALALEHVVSIVEHLVHASLLPSAANEVRKTTPPRPPRPRSSPG